MRTGVSVGLANGWSVGTLARVVSAELWGGQKLGHCGVRSRRGEEPVGETTPPVAGAWLWCKAQKPFTL